DDVFPYDLLDRPAKDRIVRAAKDQRIDAGVEQRLEVNLGHLAGYVRIGPSLLGEPGAEWRGTLDHFDPFVEALDRARIGLRPNRSLGSDDADTSARPLHRGPSSRLHAAEDRDRQLLPHPRAAR